MKQESHVLQDGEKVKFRDDTHGARVANVHSGIVRIGGTLGARLPDLLAAAFT
ncbi:MAG: hypothetical protein SGJ27_26225 [Candidatus Melainabacteria bacterium]|nr:hypothetical protein [Candidatus Melainabacteria bacterium]